VTLGSYHGATVALKVSRKSQRRHRNLESALTELRIYRRLRHPNIVTFYGACIDPNTMDIALVLEYVHGQPLRQVIPRRPLSNDEDMRWRLLLADDICCALTFLHAQTPVVIHGDIKGCNILVEAAGAKRTARLLDFGLSRLLTPDVRRLGGSARWVAPEVLRDQASPAADIFSFGRLVYMIATGRTPLSDLPEEAIVDQLRRGVFLHVEWPPSMHRREEVLAFAETCMEERPEARPSMAVAQGVLREWVPQALSGRSCGLAESVQQLREAVGTESRPACEERPKKKPVEMLYKGFAPTPLPSKIFSIAYALSSWNIPVTGEHCCPWHAVLATLERVHKTLASGRCGPSAAIAMDQCSKCGLMCSIGDCMQCGMSGEPSRSLQSVAPACIAQDSPDACASPQAARNHDPRLRATL